MRRCVGFLLAFWTAGPAPAPAQERSAAADWPTYNRDLAGTRYIAQNIHHELWDYNLPLAPGLFEIERGGERIPILAQVGKSAFTGSDVEDDRQLLRRGRRPAAARVEPAARRPGSIEGGRRARPGAGSPASSLLVKGSPVRDWSPGPRWSQPCLQSLRPSSVLKSWSTSSSRCAWRFRSRRCVAGSLLS